ncbi:DEAD/DEAH box helicase [Actinobaculum sp. 313]|uniref:DEAD/DEAH box helicase n=1 Tax=Actinobaculum sp. 313 TaxID=2495645 RepID=UPI000D52A29D|nr:DEAD/DEAH box helicase [Actinobaculum sp. 313]AWE42397.1 DEAD/DEAH box helicase [Actinobaculum sp. 313]
MDHDALLTDYMERYAARGIHLDDFQVAACRALSADHDVLVCAPTGSGKTVVAHYAVELALATGRRCVYTAPIKALSNQKYTELTRLLGQENVGLLTGDTVVNREAQILVVTTEVLRNMLLQGSDTDHFGYTILDEVHYLADRDRGPVWEEIILSLPETVRLVSLSATIANTDELVAWMRSVRGETELITSEVRPVPLSQFVSVGNKVYPLYADDGVTPSRTLTTALARAENDPRGRNRRITAGERHRLVNYLSKHDMLPAIEFIFSRKGCDEAVAALQRRGVTLTSTREQKEIRQEIATLRETLSASDRRAVRFDSYTRALLNGFGAHHAGVFPALKELTERLVERGLIRLVYATGTLALGIDMPVRTVVVEELRRWDGSDFVDMTATEYTQLIGRAGRRGRDTHGNAVVLADAELDPEHLADLGSGRLEPLLSAFQPSYNTVINLLAQRSYQEARQLMGSSFAQFQRDADLGEVEARRVRLRRRIVAEEERLECDFGDLVGYLRLRGSAGRAAKSARKAAKKEYQRRIAKSFDAATTGSLYAFARDGELFYGVVLSAERHRLRIIDWYGQMSWLRVDALSSEMRAVGRVELPHGRSLRSPQTREQVADAILAAVQERSDLGVDRDLLESWSRFAVPDIPELASHPCAACPDIATHIREGETLLSLDGRLQELNALSASYVDSVGRDFDNTVGVLRELGLLRSDDVGTARLGPGAALLRQLHIESDLLLYQCLAALQEGEVDAAGMAGWASMFLVDDRMGTNLPQRANLRTLSLRAIREAEFLQTVEQRHSIQRTAAPTPGCTDLFALWASGADLETCLRMVRLSAGDFIAMARRLVDLLGQIALAGSGTWIETTAFEARRLVRRSELL